MPRSYGSSVENNFRQGLITDATALNFPENACTETLNCIFDETGRVSRRLGFTQEENFEERGINREEVVVNSYHWKSAAGTGDNAFIVVQVGDSLDFYKLTSDSISSQYATTISLVPFNIGGAPDPGLSECQFASGDGYLFVFNPHCDTFYVEYDPSTNQFEPFLITLQIRDVEGITEDDVPTDERNVDLTDEHHYNLLNQGWPQSRINSFKNSSNNNGTYPSNADVWWYFKNAEGEFDGELFNDIATGNTPAPKGYFLLDPYYQDRSDVSGIGNFPVTTSGSARASCGEFFAGRVWYGGIESQEYSNKIYYSQIIENKRQFGYCYQKHDPTSEQLFDLLATDGGVISINDCGRIIKMVSVETTLLVFATNGVWGITGNEGTGFKATDYTIRKLASTPAINSSSFLTIAGYPAWWNIEGIYTVQVDAQLGAVQVKPAVEQRILEFFKDIPADSKKYARGYYNPSTRIVQWLYSSETPESITERYEFDRILNWNILTGAFYPWSINTAEAKVNGVLAVDGYGADIEIENVQTTFLENVTDDSLAIVTVQVPQQITVNTVFKYLITYQNVGDVMTFAECSNTDYLDWVDIPGEDGSDYESYFISGYRIRGEGNRKWQENYLTIYGQNNPEPSVFKVQGLWDFATSVNSNRWTTTQTVTFTSNDYSVQKKRLKIRGHGVALQFRISSVSGEPFDIIGWTGFESINTRT